MSNIIPYLTGPVAALAVLVWVVWMQRQDISELRAALNVERRRADSAEEAARTMNTLLDKALDDRSTRTHNSGAAS